MQPIFALLFVGLALSSEFEHKSTQGQWAQVATRGTYIPPARYLAASTDVGSHVNIFGGVGADGTYLNDLFEYNSANSRITLLSNAAYGPSARAGACAVTLQAIDGVRNETFVIFGGEDGNKYYNDLWSYEFGNNIWSKLSTNLSPQPRAFHDCVLEGALLEERISVFGGVSGSGDYLGVDHFVYYDLAEKSWHVWENNAPLGIAPSARAFTDGYSNYPMADSDESPSEFTFFGGYDGNNCLQDTWTYVYDTQTWYNVPTGSSTPQPTAGYAGVHNSGDYDIYGGLQNCNTCVSDLSGIDHSTNTWFPIKNTGGVSPPGRFGMSMVGTGGELFMFGGASGSFVNGSFVVDTVFDDGFWGFYFM